MIVRTVATAALGTAIALAPAVAASAETYPAPEGSLTCSVTQIPVDQTFTCTITSTGDYAQLQTVFSGDDATIAGTVTSAEVALDGTADFTVTAPSIVGTIGITGIVDGEAIDTASVEVVAEDTGGTTTGVAGAGGGGLSGTGFENEGLAIGAGVLLVAGAATVYIAARRRANHS
ncbi:hypothetical protein [Demequina iriomotensis]|uniref:hypothetical protein n=1 Tax=Demequina iriomotensis TaxID=1536641 RepID=UPI000783DEFC|nr:hypothetical protein [Demequina iriomotensis]